MCFAHGKVRKSLSYTGINRHNGRALISGALLPVYKSKIVGYSRRALSSIARNKYFSTFERHGIPFQKHARRLTLRSRVWRQSLFTKRSQISTDLWNRRSNWIAKNRRFVEAFPSKARNDTRVYAHIRTGHDRRVTRHRFDNGIGLERTSAFLRRTFLHPIVVLHYRTDAIWNSISLYVFPMNNIGSVSKSCRWHDHDSNSRPRERCGIENC